MDHKHIVFSKTKRVQHKPLRTLVELADEIGVPWRVLQGKLGNCVGAPPPQVDGRNHANRATWYDREEVLKWWSSLSA